MGFSKIVGHEFVGVVEKAGRDAAAMEGKRVVGEINIACETCNVCAGGGVKARNHCPNRSVLGILNKDGCYASHAVLPARNLWEVPQSISDVNATFVEPLAAACRIVEQGCLSGREAVAVIGDGKLGLLVAEVVGREVQKHGGDHGAPMLFGRHPNKMAKVSRASGVSTEHASNAGGYEGQFDVVVDVTGTPEGITTAKSLCKPLGTIVLKSTCAAPADFNTAPFVVDEVTVKGSRCGPFGPALRLLEGGLDLSGHVSAEYPLKKAVEAVEKCKERDCLKVHIIPN